MPGGHKEPAGHVRYGSAYRYAESDVVDATDEYADDDAAADVGFAPGRSPIGSATTWCVAASAIPCCRESGSEIFPDRASNAIRSWLYKLRLPARFCPRVFCADLRSRKTKLPPDPIRARSTASGMLSSRLRKRDVS